MGIDAVITFDQPLEPLDDLAYDLARWIGPDHFYSHPCIATTGWYEANHQVHLWSRYYGPGYERGDWPHLRAILVFLQPRVTDLRYGGDSGGAEDLEPAADVIAVNDKHWLAHGYPYRWERDTRVLRYDDLPEGCETPFDTYNRPMIRHGWGADYASFYSPATGEKREWRNGWQPTDKETQK